ncbi:flagellar biosynthetic protein FliO [Peribacillus kribbensis]|uniref:flagellar biosynthetic protein FliO n=1 Tax=Peribacillus kribbensis TaxID=356658 RepID=UPI0003FA84F5|nr:flagellar biosynthetic protein FliO [Peribacillus kribbensis]
MKQVIGILLLLTFVIFHGSYAHAAETDKSVKDWYDHPQKAKQSSTKGADDSSSLKESSSGGFTFWDFLRMIFATIFVVALLYFMLRFITKKNRGFQKAGVLQNLGGTALGGSKSIQLVKVGNSILVVGVGDTIQLLKEIDNEEEYSLLLKEHEGRLEGMMQPTDVFSKWIKRRNGGTANESFTGQLKKQLEEISKSRRKIAENVEKKGGAEDE